MFLMLNGIEIGTNIKYTIKTSIVEIKNPKKPRTYINLFMSFMIIFLSFLIEIKTNPIKYTIDQSKKTLAITSFFISIVLHYILIRHSLNCFTFRTIVHFLVLFHIFFIR